MKELLSQDEIDALLSEVGNSQQTIETKFRMGIRKIVNPYDFKSPEKLSKTQLRAIEMIHEVFSQRLTVTLTTYFMSPTRVTLRLLEQLTFDDFTNTLPSPTLLVTFTMIPLPGTSLRVFDPILVLSMTDRLLGEPGKFSGPPRELTDLEQRVFPKTLEKMYPCLAEAWSRFANISPKSSGLHSNPQFVQIASPQDAVAITTFEISMPKISGKMMLCYPYMTLRPLAEQLNARQWLTEKGDSAGSEHNMQTRKSLQSVKLPIRVELGSITITPREFNQLEPGDILKLDTRPGDELPVFVGNHLKFLGKVGLLRRRFAVQITKIAS